MAYPGELEGVTNFVLDSIPGQEVGMPTPYLRTYRTGYIHRGLNKLNQIINPRSTNIWNQGRHSDKTLRLEGDLKIKWDNYIFALQRDHFRLLDLDDELVWKKSPHGVYTPKLGYTTLSVDHL
jgi:hypothetical protein